MNHNHDGQADLGSARLDLQSWFWLITFALFMGAALYFQAGGN